MKSVASNPSSKNVGSEWKKGRTDFEGKHCKHIVESVSVDAFLL
jgi:hypothetical protein